MISNRWPGEGSAPALPSRSETIKSELLIDLLSPPVVIEDDYAAGDETVPKVFRGATSGAALLISSDRSRILSAVTDGECPEQRLG